MMSLSTIREHNFEAAERASAEGLEPFVHWTASEVHERERFPFPHLGDHRPQGWELTETYFVDSSGFGEPGGPALTVDAFRNIIQERIEASDDITGWAVIEAGQFQVWVGEFHNDPRS